MRPQVDGIQPDLKLLTEAHLWTRGVFRTDHVEFKLTFECTWDEEHGLGASYEDWRLTDFAGTAD